MYFDGIGFGAGGIAKVALNPLRLLIVLGRFCCLVALGSGINATVRADSFTAKLIVTSLDPAIVHVEGATSAATRAWSFRSAHSASTPSNEKISDLKLSSPEGEVVPVRKLAPGEFEAERASTRFSYNVRLTPPSSIGESAHVSWLTPDRGVILLGDVLPLMASDGRITLDLPPGWTAYSAENKNAQGSFEIPDSSKSSFIIGRDLRVRKGRASSMNVTYVIAGEWAFSDEELATESKESLGAYVDMIGVAPRKQAMVVLLPFPVQVAGNVWNAETRGGTVLLLSGRLPARTAALAQLNGALTHELFHLWVPNGLLLEGEYGWFYEGFTLYQALRAGMRLGRLSFQDYLNALGRAFDGYTAVRAQKEVSLIEASDRAWTINPALQYHKGMLVAFLYDLTVLRQTDGKSSINDAYRELFKRHGSQKTATSAAPAVMSALDGLPGMRAFSKRYIQEPNKIDLNTEIAPFGLRLEKGGIRTQVAVAEKITTQQRDLLRRLGYNGNRNEQSR